MSDALRHDYDRMRQRAERAEAECLEQARLNGMGSEREAKLLAEAAKLRKDAERWRPMFLKLLDAAEELHSQGFACPDCTLSDDDEAEVISCSMLEAARTLENAAIARKGER